jgi:L-cystine uptake protein TcyP (sodium:dicarboxylate symporter family)
MLSGYAFMVLLAYVLRDWNLDGLFFAGYFIIWVYGLIKSFFGIHLVPQFKLLAHSEPVQFTIYRFF